MTAGLDRSKPTIVASTRVSVYLTKKANLRETFAGFVNLAAMRLWLRHFVNSA